MLATRRLVLVLGLLLGLQAALAVDIKAEYGVCPKYVVKQFDTLYDIATNLGISQADLEASAKACGAQLEPLQVSQELCLPGYISARCANVLETDPDRPWCQAYVVQPADTLASVADKFDIKEEELVELNMDYLVGGELPEAGKYIRLQGWDQVKCRDFNDNDLPSCRVYTVQQGDIATDIARKFLVDVKEMLELNGLKADDTLPLNFKLKLPKWNESCPPDGVPAVLPSDTVDCRVTELQMGENLFVLAERYLTSTTLVLAVNPGLGNGSLVQPGQYINIPPFPATCVGQGNLVDVPGQTTVPANYDYNGLAAASGGATGGSTTGGSTTGGSTTGGSTEGGEETPATPAAPAPSLDEGDAAPGPVAQPPMAPSPEPVFEVLPPVVDAPPPVPAPADGAASTAASALLAAALAVLAGAMLLL